ncbi:MAG: hypothetical protein IT178_01910 [Acidobacteria bacterium]|nr:hypothetical protein [Acidobacteriota bacterium]
MHHADHRPARESSRRAGPARRAVTLALDALALLFSSIATFVVVTGGGVVDVGSIHVSARTATNPLIVTALIVAFRSWLSPSLGVLGTRVAAPRRVAERLDALLEPFLSPNWPGNRARACIAGLVLLSLVLRIANARHPGFITGDDVEIHELTLSTLFGDRWDIWGLRNAFFPLVFVLPAQALLSVLGINGTEWLVFGGRLSVVLWSTASIALLYGIGRRLDSVGVGVLAAVLFATSRLHLWFGSTELPRPVAAVALLAAFYVLVRFRSGVSAVAAGALVGTAAALRFGEVVFIAAATLHLAIDRRYRDAALVAAGSAVTAIAIVTVVDAWYWSDPLHSLMNIVRYTLVEGRSSRGFQPWWHYVGRFSEWTTLPVLLASVVAFRTRHWPAALWAWSALFLLSTLPHKEARYMVAVQPFVCLASAGAVVEVLRALRGHKREAAAAAVAAVMVFSVCLELANWRIRRSDTGVALAQKLVGRAARGVAAEQLWRLGGRLYLRDVPTVVEVTDPSAAAIKGLAHSRTELDHVVLLRETDNGEVASALASEGFAREADGDGRSDYVVYTRGGELGRIGLVDWRAGGLDGWRAAGTSAGGLERLGR